MRGLPFLPCRSVAARVAALLSFLGLACQLVSPAAAEEFPQPVTTEYYFATLQNPEPIDGDTLFLDPEPYCNSGYGCETPEPPLYFLRFRGGTSYFDSQVEDRIGGAYSLDLAVPISNAVGGYASVSVNHLPGASQYLATIGILKGSTDNVRGRFGFHTKSPADTELRDRMARIGYTVLFDQFADSRVSGMYVSQIRSTLSYSFYQDAAIGIQYTKPIQSDVVKFQLAPAVQFRLPLDFSEAISIYDSRWYGNTQLSGSVTYRDGINAVGYSGNIRRPVNDRVTAFVNANYVEKGL